MKARPYSSFFAPADIKHNSDAGQSLRRERSSSHVYASYFFSAPLSRARRIPVRFVLPGSVPSPRRQHARTKQAYPFVFGRGNVLSFTPPTSVLGGSDSANPGQVVAATKRRKAAQRAAKASYPSVFFNTDTFVLLKPQMWGYAIQVPVRHRRPSSMYGVMVSEPIYGIGRRRFREGDWSAKAAASGTWNKVERPDDE